jgi:hypothetical protein
MRQISGIIDESIRSTEGHQGKMREICIQFPLARGHWRLFLTEMAQEHIDNSQFHHAWDICPSHREV